MLSRRHFSGIWVLVALLALPSLSAAPDEPWRIDSTRSSIAFVADSRFGKVRGTFGRWKFRGTIGADLAAQGELVVETASLDTGLSRRDTHLRSEDFFDCARHPEAIFALSSVRQDGNTAQVQGTLTLRGKTVEVPVRFMLKKSPTETMAFGSFLLNRRTFGMNYDSRLNPIQDEVRVEVTLHLLK